MTVIEDGTVLVAVSEYGEFGSLLSLCRKIESELRLHPVVVFAPGYGLVHEHGRQVEFENWSWAQLGSRHHSFRFALDATSGNGYFRVSEERGRPADSASEANAAGHRPRRGRLSSALFGLGLSALTAAGAIVGRRYRAIVPPRRSFYAHAELKGLLRHAEKLFDRLNPRLILSGQDYALSVTSYLSHFGDRSGIRTVIVPFNMPPTTREIIETFAYHGYNRLTKLQRWAAKAVNPKWLNVRRGVVYSRVGLDAAFAADSLGLTPREPWLPNSGRGVVFVPSAWAYDYYREAGIPDAQLRLTGATWSDQLVRSASTVAVRRQGLVASLIGRREKKRRAGSEGAGLQADRVVIVSWPPNQYPRQALGCSSYQELCRQFILAIKAIQGAAAALVAVSLHPTLTDPKLLRSLEKNGIAVLRGGLIDYVDCADVFVSTVSSTSFWALQCGIPAINFDGYLYGYTEFDQAGAITVTTPMEVFVHCRRLLGDRGEYEAARSRVVRCAERFAETGGRNTERIMGGLAEFVAGSQPPGSSHPG